MSDEDAPSSGQIDLDILDRMNQRLSGSSRFSKAVLQPDAATDSLVADYDTGYFPATIDRAYLQIRWYETDDFSIHYSEQYQNGDVWECRWDRHPNDHNTREHFHPPPDGSTPGSDAVYSADWRDVLTRVLIHLDERIQSFWE